MNNSLFKTENMEAKDREMQLNSILLKCQSGEYNRSTAREKINQLFELSSIKVVGETPKLEESDKVKQRLEELKHDIVFWTAEIKKEKAKHTDFRDEGYIEHCRENISEFQGEINGINFMLIAPTPPLQVEITEKHIRKFDHILTDCPTCGGKCNYNDVTDTFEHAQPKVEITKEEILERDKWIISYAMGYRKSCNVFDVNVVAQKAADAYNNKG